MAPHPICGNEPTYYKLQEVNPDWYQWKQCLANNPTGYRETFDFGTGPGSPGYVEPVTTTALSGEAIISISVLAVVVISIIVVSVYLAVRSRADSTMS